MHYYRRNIGDYAKKTGRLSFAQHGAYTLLLDACYDREKFPTEEEAIDWTWASTPEEIEAVKVILKRFFVLENGVYIQNRIQEELADFAHKSETNKRIAIERETKRRENSTNRAHDVHDQDNSVHALAPNHKPITNNHKPRKRHTDQIPYDQIVDEYHKALPELDGVRQMNAKRKKHIQQIWLENEDHQKMEFWAWYFTGIRKSKFYMGENDRGWKADFDHLINPTKFLPITEKLIGMKH